jgi:hypothetical protein
MMPGFDFLQSLMKNAGAGLPGMNQWIAPTLDPDELEKRIGELRTVQFWLEQNARLLGATVQTLEVQRLTLSTLKTMNLPLAEINEALRIKLPDAPEPQPAPPPPPAPVAPPVAQAPAPEPAAAPEAAAAPGVVDPMAWWGSLTQQFTEIAAQAMKDVRIDAAAAKPDEPAPTAQSANSAKSAKSARRAPPAKKRVRKTAARKAPAARG